MENYNEKDFIIENNVLVKYNGKGGDVVIPDSVTEIGRCAFYGCGNLISIHIPDSVTEIGEFAFVRCSGLTSIHIPNSVVKIGSWVFCGCNGLTSIHIPNSVVKIGRFAFSGCCNLTSINIPDSVTEIGTCAFIDTKIKKQLQSNIAYKGFSADMTCRGFKYQEGETYTCNEARICDRGFHACLNPLHCLNYYSGNDVVFHEVILEDRSDETNYDDDTKICGRKITIGRRLTFQEMSEIFNQLNK